MASISNPAASDMTPILKLADQAREADKQMQRLTMVLIALTVLLVVLGIASIVVAIVVV